MKRLFLLLSCCPAVICWSQQLKELVPDPQHPLTVKELRTGEGIFPVALPLFSVELNKKLINSNDAESTGLFLENGLNLETKSDQSFKNGYKAIIQLTNRGLKPVSISNIIPFGAGNNRYYISGKPLSDTSRSFLYRPGVATIPVVVPHNNNDLNFTAVELGGNKTLYALIRRSNDSIQNYLLNRSPYILQSGKTISFDLYADVVDGDWHTALENCFREKMLYGVNGFDNSLYERKDLDYIRRSYTMHLMMAWEKNYYNAKDSVYLLQEFLADKKKLYGGDDIFTIWPTWPVLGLDQRTQWDLMKDLPGGLMKQKELSGLAHLMGTKYFISYNPWDDANENVSLQRMGEIIKQIDADGVILDTRAEGSRELQDAADKAKPGVVLYSEGMATPKDMQGIISGRVHNDIYFVPLLNLNKLIKPDFAIFRVTEINKEPVRREFELSLFNGYGVEINIMRPGRPEWINEEYKFWGKCVRILKESSPNFVSKEWTPLIPSLKDKIYINRWPENTKTIYTIFSLLPEGYNDALFEAEVRPGYHFVDLWHHEEVGLKKTEGKDYAMVELESFNQKWLGTNNEGSVSAVAQLPLLLNVTTEGDKILVEAKKGKSIRVWAGEPSWEKECFEIKSIVASFHLFQRFGRVQGKYVVQLFDGNDLLDECVLDIKPGTPMLVSEPVTVIASAIVPTGMVKIPSGAFTMQVVNGDEFISYPQLDYPKKMSMKSFYMDRYPVTNRQFKEFLEKSHYLPSDTMNFLKQWTTGNPKKGEEDFPVVNISYEDAGAYTQWAGKRLPTEAEWQYAAQTTDGRLWPWGNEVEQKGKQQKNISTTLTLVDYGVPDPTLCNTGDGKLYPVGKYRKGANPYGLQDLVGCVWQMTSDRYQSDSYEYILLKGGSYYRPGTTWWYVQGGPKPLYYRQMLLRVSQGFERNATVGFRCVKDAE